ncbi:MAG TPA: hypothetical protein VFV33_08565, partial [Gemmatimonadaceae bacterium]|nr:hypothetical protein [Gemmatimonadaceae bacterium]
LPLLAACQLTQPDSKAEGQIYYRVQQDLSYPANSQAAWCELVSVNYLDDNPAVPFVPSAHMESFAGPSEPGTYNAEYSFSSTGPVIYFSYTLELPPTGYKRYYTRMLRKYNQSLNRCLDVSKEVAKMTWVDEKL